MIRATISLVLIAIFACTAFASSCKNPKATVTSFSTEDATILTQLAHIGEFSLQCENGAKPNLFAEFSCGAVVPVARVGEDKYQISWTEEIKKSSKGAVVVRLLDEEGYANVRKAQRDNEKASNVKSLIDITITTKSAYKGPYVKAELIASAFIAIFAYYALTTKNKIQA